MLSLRSPSASPAGAGSPGGCSCLTPPSVPLTGPPPHHPTQLARCACSLLPLPYAGEPQTHKAGGGSTPWVQNSILSRCLVKTK